MHPVLRASDQDDEDGKAQRSTTRRFIVLQKSAAASGRTEFSPENRAYRNRASSLSRRRRCSDTRRQRPRSEQHARGTSPSVAPPVEGVWVVLKRGVFTGAVWKAISARGLGARQRDELQLRATRHQRCRGRPRRGRTCLAPCRPCTEAVERREALDPLVDPE